MNTVFLLLLLCQNANYAPALKSSTDTQRREADLREVAAAASRQPPSPAEQNKRDYAAARDEQFAQKFNKLIATLMDFADAYKNGQVNDIKKAQAVRKAWLDLEKSEAIFQDEKKK
jgi:hypothetical protein